MSVPQSHPSVSRVLHENYPRTVEYRVLFAAALIKTGFTHINTLVTGLPSYQAMQSDLKEELRSQLTGDHIINGTKITIDRVKVLAQPVGAFTNYAWHNPGLREMLTEAKTLVLDPGFFSLDWVLIHNRSLVKSSSSSSKKEMSFLLDRTREVFEETYGRKVDVGRIEDAVRHSKTKILSGGEYYPLADSLNKASNEVVKAALKEARNSVLISVDSHDLILLGDNAHFFNQRVGAAPRNKTSPVFRSLSLPQCDHHWF